MDKFIFRLISCVLFVFMASPALLAQDEAELSDTLVAKMNLYGLKDQSPVLFIHFDKNIYTNNEEIWFTGYLISSDINKVKEHHILSVSLISDDDNKIATQANFIMDGGLSFGSMYIPDSVAAGNYHLAAYTDRLVNGKPQAFFKQAITVKTTNPPAFNLSLNLIDSAQTPPGKISTLLTAKSKELPLIEAPVKYRMSNTRRGAVLATAKTGVTGEHILTLDKGQVSEASHVLRADVGDGKLKESIRIALPVRKAKATIRFYPEGGNLVTGKASNIGWEAKGAKGEPLSIKGIVLKNGKPVDTISTDSYGMGVFKLAPQKGAGYQVKVSRAGVIDTVCALPKALAQGLVLQVVDALSPDSITIKLQSTRQQLVKILLHNYREVFASREEEIYPEGLVAKFAVADLPRGLTMITVLDSIERPYAERVFFAHYDKRSVLKVKTDQKEYDTRQKVKLNIKLGNAAGIPLSGYVSVACVQDNRMSYKLTNNIESYYYLTSQLQNIPLKDNLMGDETTDREYLNKLLLIKGWSRYTWPEMMKAQMADTIQQYQNLAYNGDVTFSNKPLKKPIDLSAIADTLAQIVHTDSSGHFKMNERSMVTPADKKMILFINGKAKTAPYAIHINNPFEAFTQKLADTLTFNNDVMPASGGSNEDLVMALPNKIKQLKEVQIKAVKSNQFFASLPRFTVDDDLGKNECGDWVCFNNILNCGNHPFGNNRFQPLKKGDVVKVFRGGQYVNIVYRGCILRKEKEYTSMLRLKGIYAHKEFYVVDYDKEKDAPPDYQSTIFWKYQVPLSSSAETNLTFFTNDIAGPFKIVVQGLTDEDVVYGEQTFNVKRKLP
ncbi:hypothetical protein GWR56_00660 [Mucilaginibacter sp. 14171R-50]|uniref:hypothetical protein n=1 Tax=Mucilaginibacter sp. 14171R-50 TaxID=2703789 RepID=UPI00138BD1DB|nr:hypothetical protein [Mucilaginibacter sp. 14171R-50]QHS54131.1 hypothetical protein GWR56_00660 [Mucilaginibacter sp. 14171R-50]